MATLKRYTAICIQTANFPTYEAGSRAGAKNKNDVHKALQRSLDLIDGGIISYSYASPHPFKLIVFPEFFIQGIGFPTIPEYFENDIPCYIPGEETDRIVEYAKKFNCYIQAGTILERDHDWPGHVFNTACIIGPEGVLTKYRKVQTWLPLEAFSSPHSIKGYDQELFPVADTPIGKLAAGICYDGFFPEIWREYILKGAEVLLWPSAVMPPWNIEEPMRLAVSVGQTRALENSAYMVYCNQGGWVSTKRYLGGSGIIDFEGRVIIQVPQAGEQCIFGTIELDSLRDFRANMYNHNMSCHIRTEAYTYFKKPVFPVGTHDKDTPYSAIAGKEGTDVGRDRLFPGLKEHKKPRREMVPGIHMILDL